MIDKFSEVRLAKLHSTGRLKQKIWVSHKHFSTWRESA